MCLDWQTEPRAVLQRRIETCTHHGAIQRQQGPGEYDVESVRQGPETGGERGPGGAAHDDDGAGCEGAEEAEIGGEGPRQGVAGADAAGRRGGHHQRERGLHYEARILKTLKSSVCIKITFSNASLYSLYEA